MGERPFILQKEVYSMYASEFRRLGRESLRGRWGTAILTSFVASLLGVGSVTGSGSDITASLSSFASSFSESMGSTSEYGFSDYYTEEMIAILMVILAIMGISFFIQLALFIIRGACQLGNASFYLHVADGTDASFSDLFSQFRRIGSGIAMNILIAIYVTLWSLLFFIPGIIKGLSYSMTTFILAENPGMSANEAITRSRHLMDGNKWRLFCLNFSFLGWTLLSMIPLLLGLFFSLSAAGLAVYEETAVAIAAILLALVFILIGPIAVFIAQLFLIPYQNATLAVFYRQITAEREQTMIGEY